MTIAGILALGIIAVLLIGFGFWFLFAALRLKSDE